jgi:YD repeat-containing protein
MPPLTYSYDAAGRLGEVKKSGVTYASAITDTVGRLQSISRVNGATTTYTYDGADRVTRLRTAVGANTRGDFNYNLSRGSQVTAVTETLGLGTRNVTYGYDGLRRLVSAATSTGSTPPQTYGYEYDLVGNRRSVTVNGKKVEQHTYDAADQVVGWTYDGAGNLLQDGSNTYTYDALKRLAQVDKTPGQTYIYTYNGDNVLEREQRTGPFNWIITYFTLDTAGGLPERLGARVNNGTTSWYMRGWGQELSRENFQGQANTVSWYLPDRLGSVRGEMDDAGGLSTTYNYEPNLTTPRRTTEPAFHSFPLEVNPPAVNGVVLRESAYYDYRMGTMTSVKDPNNQITSAEYDEFGRMIKLRKPGDESGDLTVLAEYNDSEIPFKYLGACAWPSLPSSPRHLIAAMQTRRSDAPLRGQHFQARETPSCPSGEETLSLR